jgi:outer membrane protein TolC
MTPIFTRATWAGVLAAALAACGQSRPTSVDDLERTLAGSAPLRGRAADITAGEPVLATGTVDAMVQHALVHNPDLVAERARVAEQLARVSVVARRPDPELKYEQWGVPLVRPYALGEADTLMVGVRQSFPAPGSLDAQERAARAEVEQAVLTLRARQLDVARQVESTCYQYLLAEREQAIHLEHAELTQRLVDQARSSFRVGATTEHDVLRVAVEIHRLHRDVARLDQRRLTAVALLNTLMGRPPATALTPSVELAATEIDLPLAQLEALARTDRPEVRAAVRGVARGTASVEAARAAATWPTFMVGLDYMYMPYMHERHSYGAMVSVSLPWFGSRRRDQTTASERGVTADRHAVTAATTTVHYEVTAAFAGYQAARSSYLITSRDLVPAAQRSLEAAQAGFAGGRGNTAVLLDALRAVLDIRLEEIRALVELKQSIIDLERAVGTELAERPLATGGQP